MVKYPTPQIHVAARLLTTTSDKPAKIYSENNPTITIVDITIAAAILPICLNDTLYIFYPPFI